jgi:hypothetical protein
MLLYCGEIFCFLLSSTIGFQCLNLAAVGFSQRKYLAHHSKLLPSCLRQASCAAVYHLIKETIT